MALLAVIFVTISVFHAGWGSDFNNLEDALDRNIEIKEAPFIAQLFTDQQVPCAGVIVNETFILTTENCCIPNKERHRQIWRARVGTNGNQISVRNIKIKNTFYTPGLKATICIVQLAEHLSYNSEVDQLPLDNGQAYLEEGKLVNLTAFRRNLESHTSVLHQKTLPINGTDWCKEDAKRLNYSIFCAGDRKTTACQGDAGGILTANGTVIGVLSTASPDCHSTARFSKISYYRKWILDTIEKFF